MVVYAKIFLSLLILLCSLSGLEGSKVSSEDDIVIINAPDLNSYHEDNSLRFKRDLSFQKVKNHENCGIVKAIPPVKDQFQSFLMNVVQGSLLERKKAFSGEFPWIAGLVMRKHGQRFYCGGSLIDHFHILTSASCVARMSSDDLGRLKVLLGSHNIYAIYESGQLDAKVSQIAYHKGFDSLNMENNIALIRLRKPVAYTELIQPICLSNGSNIYDHGNALATVSGWGQLLHDPLKYLHKLDVRIWDSARCIKKYNEGKTDFFPEIRDDSLCAGSPVPANKNLCQGNNGSPLVIKRHKRFELIGITSWGVGAEVLPCVYTRVDKYLFWIQRSIESFKKT